MSNKDQCASRVLNSVFILLFVEPDAIDHQLSRVFFLHVADGHRGPAGSAPNSITDLDIVFIRPRFLQRSPMSREFCLQFSHCIGFRASGNSEMSDKALP